MADTNEKKVGKGIKSKETKEKESAQEAEETLVTPPAKRAREGDTDKNESGPKLSRRTQSHEILKPQVEVAVKKQEDSWDHLGPRSPTVHYSPSRGVPSVPSEPSKEKPTAAKAKAKKSTKLKKKGNTPPTPPEEPKEEAPTPDTAKAVSQALQRKSTAEFPQTPAQVPALHGDSDSDSEDSNSSSQSGSRQEDDDDDDKELTLAQLQAKKKARARYMRFSRSLKSKSTMAFFLGWWMWPNRIKKAQKIHLFSWVFINQLFSTTMVCMNMVGPNTVSTHHPEQICFKLYKGVCLMGVLTGHGK